MTNADPAWANLTGLLPQLQAIYTDIHAHPELSMQEARTAGLAADHLRKSGFEVGGTVPVMHACGHDFHVTWLMGASVLLAQARQSWKGTVLPVLGSLQAGTKENVIPDEATLLVNVRTFDEGVRQRVLAAITRIVNAEAVASGSPRPPEITTLDHYPLTRNDAEATRRAAVWAKAQAEGKLGEIPTNHSPHFAPVIHPTLESGVQAMVVAARAWLAAPAA